MSTLYLDCDGVIADFEGGCLRLLGFRPRDVAEDFLWDSIREHGKFYSSLDMMPDAHMLLLNIPVLPRVLTGKPWNVPNCDAQKKRWVREKVDPFVQTRTKTIVCMSADKHTYCKPGDMLVDDRESARDPWEAAGGRFIHHTSAIETLRQLGVDINNLRTSLPEPEEDDED